MSVCTCANETCATDHIRLIFLILLTYGGQMLTFDQLMDSNNKPLNRNKFVFRTYARITKELYTNML